MTNVLDLTLEKMNLLSLISHSRRQQELYLDTISNCVVLAANQVQDVRLEILEKQATISTNSIFFDFLVSLALGPVAGVIVSRLTGAMFRPLLRTRQSLFVGKMTTKSPSGHPLLGKATITKRGIEVARKQFKKTTKVRIKVNTPEHSLYKEAADALVGTALLEVASRHKKAGNKNVSQQKAQKTASQEEISRSSWDPMILQALSDLGISWHAGDTAAVAIMDAALSSALHQKTAINIAHDFYSIFVQNTTDNTLFGLIEKLMNDNLLETKNIQDYSNIKKVLIRFFEASIWASLYNPNKLIESKKLTSGHQRVNVSPKRIRKVGSSYFLDTFLGNNDLWFYWIRRFPHSGYLKKGENGFLLPPGMNFFEMENAKKILNARRELVYYFKVIRKEFDAYVQSGIDILGPIGSLD